MHQIRFRLRKGKGDKEGRVEKNGAGGGRVMALWDGRPWD